MSTNICAALINSIYYKIYFIFPGLIQTFLLNGPSTSDSDCSISFQNCWSWGLSINQYYALLFCLVFALSLPLLWLHELDASHVPIFAIGHYFQEIWLTLKNLTTFNLLVYVIGIQAFTAFNSNANFELQYYVIKLTNFQSGFDTVTTYMALVTSIWLFQRYLINRNWHLSQYGSVIACSALGFVWIAAFYNAGGTQNAWFTIFIDLDTVSKTQLSFLLIIIHFSSGAAPCNLLCSRSIFDAL
jgi:hypothetical protein